MHSSRMRTTRSLSASHSIRWEACAFPGGACMPGAGGVCTQGVFMSVGGTYGAWLS